MYLVLTSVSTDTLPVGNYIEERPHPRSGLPPIRRDLDHPEPPHRRLIEANEAPYAPFLSYEDFEFAERMVNINASEETVNWFLKGIRNGKWVEGGQVKLSFTSAKDMFKKVDEVASIYTAVRRSHSYYFLLLMSV
jgi:hypothetical protein